MASYVNASLLPSEHVIYQGKCSIRAYWMIIAFGGFMAFVLGVAALVENIPPFGFFGGVFLMMYPFIARHVTELAITNKRIIAKFGIVSRRTIEINLHKIESIQVNQGIFGRLLNYGSIVIAGAGNPQAPIPNIDNPLEFRRKFMETIDSMQNKSQ